MFIHYPSNTKGAGVWDLSPFSHTRLSCPVWMAPQSCTRYCQKEQRQLAAPQLSPCLPAALEQQSSPKLDRLSSTSALG